MTKQKIKGQQAWEVEAILDERKSGNRTEFLIKWRGYSHNDNSWEPESGIACDDLLAAFRVKKQCEMEAAEEKARVEQLALEDEDIVIKKKKKPAVSGAQKSVEDTKPAIETTPVVKKTSVEETKITAETKRRKLSEDRSQEEKCSGDTVTKSKKLPLKSPESKPLKKPTKLCCVCRISDENPVIACQRCGVEVHPGCYGVQSVSADWKCALCDYVQAHPKESAESYHCCLCPSLSGALKPAVDGRWAHSACALWIPETSFGNNDTLEPVMGLSDIPKERWELVCCICNKSAYCCIQCDFGTCCESFHVTCAQDKGFYVKLVPGKDGISASMTALAYCKEHSVLNT